MGSALGGKHRLAPAARSVVVAGAALAQEATKSMARVHEHGHRALVRARASLPFATQSLNVHRPEDGPALALLTRRAKTDGREEGGEDSRGAGRRGLVSTNLRVAAAAGLEEEGEALSSSSRRRK